MDALISISPSHVYQIARRDRELLDAQALAATLTETVRIEHSQHAIEAHERAQEVQRLLTLLDEERAKREEIESHAQTHRDQVRRVAFQLLSRRI